MSEPESLNTMFQNAFVKLGDGSYALNTSGGAVADNSVDTAAIQDGAVTFAKLNSAVTVKLITKQAAQANSTATDVAGLVTDFNNLLIKLRSAGILS